ncbi:MAG: helix-turn-helix domain-containing protein [Ruminococcaceae bacterium]|nr:helix-turn-helix domain-containing protein [Oscillospiraceae bacterium]
MDTTQLIFIEKINRQAEEYIATHNHNSLEVIFYIKASGTTTIGDRKYDFSDGSVAIINRRVPHDEYHEITADIIYFNCQFSHFTLPDGVYTPKNLPMLLQIVWLILSESRLPKFSYEMMIESKLNELFILLKRELLSNRYHDMEQCMLYLGEHCNTPLNLQEVGEQFGLHYETFRHRFKKIYGMSPQSFIIYKRLMMASELLTGSEHSCTEIALMCGFADGAQFSKMFKRQFGSTPKQFREMIGADHIRPDTK